VIRMNRLYMLTCSGSLRVCDFGCEEKPELDVGFTV
jgi:hypothetical protein